jgi:DNA (cytosine-5)-methyltransferase 1
MHCDSGAAAYEFFAGGGMTRLGLGPQWRVSFANDIDRFKASVYRNAFGDAELCEADIASLRTSALPGQATLAWASFPCQDLSLAGARGGLGAPRSGSFWAFRALMAGLKAEGRAPPLLVLENVRGLLTSRGGDDCRTLLETLAADGYRTGILELDAAWFTPQSRPRVFVVAALIAPASLVASGPEPAYHSKALQSVVEALAPKASANWVWWRMPPPPRVNARLKDTVDWSDRGDEATAATLLALMSEGQRHAVSLAGQGPAAPAVGAAFRRVRTVEGRRVQRAEARFDGLAGCLRTPSGGSSRQFLIFVDGDRVSARLLAPIEAARLMGLPEDYPLPKGATRALHLLGDGVCVPVVRFLSDNLLTPLAAAIGASRAAA